MNCSGNSIIIHPPEGTAYEGIIENVNDVEALLARLFVAVIPNGNAVDVDTLKKNINNYNLTIVKYF